MKIGIALQIEKRETSRKTEEETFVRGTGEGVHMESALHKRNCGRWEFAEGGTGWGFCFLVLYSLSLSLSKVSFPFLLKGSRGFYSRVLLSLFFSLCRRGRREKNREYKHPGGKRENAS